MKTRNVKRQKRCNQKMMIRKKKMINMMKRMNTKKRIRKRKKGLAYSTKRHHVQKYVPNDVVRDYQLELPSSMTIHDSSDREFEAKLKIWQDGRIWLVGGCGSLCRQNLLEKNDTCICEFVREKYNKSLYLQVHVVHEGEGSHPNKK